MPTHVIIGGGIAATEAAQAIREHRPEDRIELVAEEARPFYVRPLLADYVAGRVTEEHLWRNFEIRAARLDIFLRTGSPVTALDRSGKSVTLANGQQVAYDRLLIATGVKPDLPALPGRELMGVTEFGTYADAVKLVEWAGYATATVVVGRGLQGVELARALRLSGLEVTMLVPDESPWFPALFHLRGEAIEQALAEHGVKVIAFDAPAELVGHSGHVHLLRTREGRELPAEIVGFALEQRPQLGFAVGAGISIADGIVVDDRLRTTDPDIYAAGDVAQLEVDGRRQPLGYGWMRGREQGEAAGRNMAGDDVRVTPGEEPEAQSLYGRTLLARWR